MKIRTAALATLTLFTTPAFAHVGMDHVHSLASGFIHPFTGFDHFAAMLAVGLWASQIGGSRLWLWPFAFVSAMLLGGAFGFSGLNIPAVESTIAASLVVFGLAMMFAVRAPVALGAALIAVFALVHGHAHGTEAHGAGFGAYAFGFVAATALLHGLGLGLGLTATRFISPLVTRGLGLATAGLGLALLVA